MRGVFEHGEFTAADTYGTAAALAAFAVGVPAYVLVKVLTPGFYARSDTKTPVRIALVAMLVNLVGNLILIWPFAHVGVGIATAASAWVNVALLYWFLNRRGHLSIDARLKAKLWRILLAGAAMGAGLWFGSALADPWLTGRLWQRVGVLILLCGSGAALYALSTFVFGVYRLGELKALLRRRG